MTPNQISHYKSLQKQDIHNRRLIRNLQGRRDELNREVNRLRKENEMLWMNHYTPHKEAESISIEQYDKRGDVVASSAIFLPTKKKNK